MGDRTTGKAGKALATSTGIPGTPVEAQCGGTLS